jgi:hypothetical protein
MGQIRIRCHQRFYGFDMTKRRCLYQRRALVAGSLGG